MAKKLLTASEAAALKGVAISTVYAAVAAGRLPHQRILSRIGLRESDVQRWQPGGYAGRPGAKGRGGRPRGIPVSAATKARIAESQRQRWAGRRATTPPVNS